MNKRISFDENPVVRHFALISLGRVIRQSQILSQELLPLFQLILIGCERKFISFEYIHKLRIEYRDILAPILNDFSPYINISTKKGNPYVYAIQGYTKILSKSGLLSSEDLKNIIKICLRNAYDETSIGKDILTNFRYINILNDIVSINSNEVFQILKAMDIFIIQFLKIGLEQTKTNLISVNIALMKLITSLYKYGEESSIFFEDFDYQFILKNLFDCKIIDPKVPFIACECIYSVVEVKQFEGFNFFFGGENFEYFNQLIDLILDDDIEYHVKAAFYILIGILFKFYTSNIIEFDVKNFLSVALNNINEQDQKLSSVVLSSILNLFKLMISLDLTFNFVDDFKSLNGKDKINSLIEQNGELSELATEFKTKLMENGFSFS